VVESRIRCHLIKKFNPKLLVSLFLVCLVGTLLWFATPTKAVNISVNNPGSGALGTPLTFSLTVNVENVDVLPVQGIQLTIFNADVPTDHVNTYINLPLQDAANQPLNSLETPTNVAYITATPGANWGSGSGDRTAYDPSSGTQYPLGNGFGYGYGSAPFQGTTSITYVVRWTPPSGWPSGNYQIEAAVAVSGSQNITKNGGSFSISSGGGGGGGGGGGFIGGGGGGPAPTPGINDVRDKANASGVFYVDTYATSPENPPSVTLKVPAGTRGLNPNGTPLTAISILPQQNAPSPAPSQALVLAYDLGPNGATFNTPVTLTMSYDPSKIPSGVAEANLYVVWYDTGTNTWVSLPTTVDVVNKKLTTQFTHFTLFAIFGSVSLPPTTTPGLTPPPSTPTQPPPALKPATFIVSKLEVAPSEITPGQSAALNVTILNNGDVSGDYQLTVLLNGAPYNTQTVTLAAHSSLTKTVNISAAATGDYTVSVENLKGSFVAKAAVASPSGPAAPPPTAAATQPATPAPPSQAPATGGGIPILWITLWVCIFIAVATTIVILITRRRTD
jgi:hypothetical protein